jgi:hypothetical protein
MFQSYKTLQNGRLKAHPKPEVRRWHIGASRRKASKIALFVDLRAESPLSLLLKNVNLKR